MENTLENKSKFFAIYYNQKVLKVTKNRLDIVSKSWNWEHSSFYLELTPLSQITDEDACNAGITKARLKNHINHPHIMTPFMCDYLRSKGYALPWMWLSVEQLVSFGWVKLTS